MFTDAKLNVNKKSKINKYCLMCINPPNKEFKFSDIKINNYVEVVNFVKTNKS